MRAIIERGISFTAKVLMQNNGSDVEVLVTSVFDDQFNIHFWAAHIDFIG